MKQLTSSKKIDLITIVSAKNDAKILKYLIPAWINDGLNIIFIDQSSVDDSVQFASKFLQKGIIEIHSFRETNAQTKMQIESLKLMLRERYCNSAFIEMKATQWIRSSTKKRTLSELVISQIKTGQLNLSADVFVFPEVDTTQKWMHYYYHTMDTSIQIYPPKITENRTLISRVMQAAIHARKHQFEERNKSRVVIREYIDKPMANKMALEEADAKGWPKPSRRSLMAPEPAYLSMISNKIEHRLAKDKQKKTHYWNWNDRSKQTAPKTIFCLYGCDKDLHFLNEIRNSRIYSTIAEDPSCLILEIWAGASKKTTLNGRRLTVATEESYANLSVKTQKFINYCYLNFNFSQLVKFDISCVRKNFKGPEYEGRKPLDLEKIEEFISTQLGNHLSGGKSSNLNDHYRGFQYIQNPSIANIEEWGRKKQATVNPQKVFKEEKIPSFYTGKCYVISHELCKLVAREGYSMAHQHKKLLNGSEDLMVARMANQLVRRNRESTET